MVHFLRAEVQRANVWRQGLDTTTSWAVVTTGAAISFAYRRADVEALAGTGMYTHQAHTVLLCALTVTEVPDVKGLVHAEDANAFVTLTPAQEILGKGLAPLQEDEGE